MAERRPLVVVNGVTRQLPNGDTLPPDAIPGGGGESSNIDGGNASSIPALNVDGGTAST